MDTLKSCNATRSGAAITVSGKGPNGQARRIAGIKVITFDETGAYAVAKDGRRYRLGH